jgi:hypothetical protein
MYGDRGSFWENRQGYLSGMPVFNAEQIRGAVMLQYVNDSVIPSLIEHVAAFRRNHVPWEFLLFGPEGYHQLNLPAQRRESMQASVDWMNFWLQGRENAEPRYAARNAEWRRQRDVQRRHEAWYAAGHPRGSDPTPGFVGPTG